MNANDRKEIKAQIAIIQAAREKIDEIVQDIKERHDNTPESLQEAPRYQTEEEKIDNLENGTSGLDDAISELESAVEK